MKAVIGGLGEGGWTEKPGKTALNCFWLHLDLAQNEENQTWVCVLFCLSSTVAPKSLNAARSRKLGERSWRGKKKHNRDVNEDRSMNERVNE